MIALTGHSGRYTFHRQKDAMASGRKFNFVFKGTDHNHSPVLIKQLLPALCDDATAVKRFRNEFDLRVAHPNIISATDYFVHEGAHYLVRNWLEGNALAQTLHRATAKRSIEICMAVLQALAHLHANKILHLDVQPKNIIIGKDHAVYLTDLGLARKIGDTGIRQPFNIYYSAPEQLLNMQEQVNETTDLFAVGMIVLELLSKRKFQLHENPEVLMNLVLASPILPDRKIDARMFAIIKKATAKPRFNLPPSHYTHEQLLAFITIAQDARYKNAGEFIDELSACKGEESIERKWWQFW